MVSAKRRMPSIASLRAGPRRDDEAGHAELLPPPHVDRRLDRAAEADLEARSRRGPSASSSSRRRPIERSADSNVCDMPIQPSPRRAARRSAASLSPPTRIGGHGCCTHLGTNTAPSKSKNSPWWSTVVLGPELLAHLDRLVDAAAARSRSRARPRPTPPRASSRRSRTRSGRRETMSRVWTARAATNGWRSPRL